jgi:hypothetical protein
MRSDADIERGFDHVGYVAVCDIEGISRNRT